MDFNVYAVMDISKTLYCNAKSVVKVVKLAFRIQPSAFHVLVTRLLTTINVFVKMGITQIRIQIVNYAQTNVYYAKILQLFV